MAQEKPILDDQAAERLPFCIPFVTPVPIPATAWNEEPTRCIRVNAEWCSYILGALECLDQPDTWIGTPEQVFDARQQVREIMLAVMGAYECEEPMPPQYVKSIDFCWIGDDPQSVRVVNVIDGVEDTVITDLTECLNIPTTYVVSLDGCDSEGMNYTSAAPGTIGASKINIYACLPEPIPGPPGPQGEQGGQGGPGDPGPPGQDGQDGVCIGCEPAAPEPATGPDDHCGAATYFVDWVDDRFDDILGVLELGADVAQFVDAVVELFGPFDLAIGGVPGILSASAGLAASVLRANVNSVVLENLRCSLFCAFEVAGNTSYQTLIDWAAAEDALAGANVGVHVWLSLILNVFPESETSRRVYIGSLSTSTECEALCDDCDDDECEGGSFTVMANNSVLGETSFVTQSDKWYTVTWTGTVITQTSAPVQSLDGFYFTTNGTTWQLGQARMQYRRNGSYTSFTVPTRSTTQTYSFVFKGDGVEKISLRLADGSYGNNSGSWTINVTCHTTNPGGTVIQL